MYGEPMQRTALGVAQRHQLRRFMCLETEFLTCVTVPINPDAG